MALLKLVLVPNEILHTPCDPIDPQELQKEEFQALIKDMKQTMKHENGVGLAAPQIGKLIRLMIVDLEDSGPTAFINPIIVGSSPHKVESEEGCLSIPKVFGIVSRSTEVDIEALGDDGQTIKTTLKGFDAIVYQHELDHLNGVLFTDPDRLIRYTTRTPL